MKELSLTEPADLGQLVSYQGGSVVSQTLIKSKAGTVTVFAFDAGEGLSEHTAPFDALVLAVDGRATVSVDDTAHVLQSGQIIRFPANVGHSVHADEPFKMMLIMVKEQQPPQETAP